MKGKLTVQKPEIKGLVVIGASRGGMRVLEKLLSALPKEFSLPVVVVQHRGGDTEDVLVRLLQEHCALTVKEPEDKEVILLGHVYLAPADYHLLVEGDHFAMSNAEPVWYSRPSIDVLFESAADSYGERVIGVILTGNNQDGAKGLAAIKNQGGTAIVQDPATAEARVMPEAAIAATNIDRILSPEKIGPFLVKQGTEHLQQKGINRWHNGKQ
ncbi:MAG: chemotaxis protein CheB [Syntrophales bacterium]|nr:chemotaxis protein CheB [Syntrophales bacterium]